MPHKNDVFYSLSVLQTAEPNANRAQEIADIESGKKQFIEFNARVFQSGRNRNFTRFREADMPAFAASFANLPFLRDHELYEIESREGTILESRLEGTDIIQKIRLTTRRGMLAYVEGQIDRFSIGWRPAEGYKGVHCSICDTPYSACSHSRGTEYNGQTCELVFIDPIGLETSAVNDPAVDNNRTGILQALDSFKLNGKTAESHTTKGVNNMPDPKPEGGNAALEQLQANQTALAEILGEQQRLAALDEQRRAGEEILVAQCEHLLTSGLATSRLPDVVQSRLRKQFEGKSFAPTELTAAIADAREEVSQLTANARVQSGQVRTSEMYTGADQLQSAMDDLIGAPRDPDKVNQKVARLSGIREAYLLMTGDRNFYGGYDERYALDSASFPIIVKNAMNKRLAQAWAKYGAAGYDWWKHIVTVEHFENIKQVDWAILGTIGSLPAVAESGEYTQLPLGDNGETSTWSKYGGYVALTLEDVINDDIRAFRRLPDEAAMGGMRNISEQVAALFTSNSGAGPTLSDNGALFNATAVTTAGGHANLLTTALGTDFTAWEAVAAAMYNQPMHLKGATGYYGTGKKQAVDPKYWLGPRALRGAANNLFVQRAQFTAQNADWYGEVIPLTVPEFTDSTDWAAVADPNILPGVMLGEIFGLTPQIIIAGKETDAAMFANDESRLKIRQFLTVGIGNWRALHKSNVA